MRQRIIDQPNHPYYGEVRRLWVVIQTLFADHLANLDDLYRQEFGELWETDQVILRVVCGRGAAEAQREIVKRIMAAIDKA